MYDMGAVIPTLHWETLSWVGKEAPEGCFGKPGTEQWDRLGLRDVSWALKRLFPLSGSKLYK